MRHFIALAFALLPTMAPAQSAPPCAPHEAMVIALAERWGETLQSIALDMDGAVIETFASETSGTWTITMTRPGQATCLIAAGHSWEAVKTLSGEPA